MGTKCFVREIRIAEIPLDRVCTECPYCFADLDYVLMEFDGALAGFRMCTKCETWFSPNVKWEIEE